MIWLASWSVRFLFSCIIISYRNRKRTKWYQTCDEHDKNRGDINWATVHSILQISHWKIEVIGFFISLQIFKQNYNFLKPFSKKKIIIFFSNKGLQLIRRRKKQIAFLIFNHKIKTSIQYNSTNNYEYSLTKKSLDPQAQNIKTSVDC